jgi:hypothetical protein
MSLDALCRSLRRFTRVAQSPRHPTRFTQVALVAAIGISPASRTVEYVDAEQLAPPSVADQLSSMEQALEAESPFGPRASMLVEAMPKAAPFFRDTDVVLHPRVYWFERDNDRGGAAST